MQKIVLAVLRLLEKVSGKHFIYLPKNRNVAGRTAVKSDEGFWYVGDVTDTRDLAYGILYHGNVEKEESGLVKRILQKMLLNQNKLNFYDIGANTGYYGVMAAYLGNGTVQTFSFEPLAECVWSIEQSSKLNSLESKIRIFQTALGDKPGSATLYVSGSGSTLHQDFLGNTDAPQQTVPVEALDNVVAKHALPNPDFIKIDVEGHELAVLRGAEKTVSQSHPVLFVEIAKTLKNLGRTFKNPEYENTFELLESWGYVIYCLDGAKLLPADRNFYSDGVHMFLCLPKEKSEQFKEIASK
jgi:FkbM family methyltransferase